MHVTLLGLYLLCTVCLIAGSDDIKVYVYGPGLDRRITLPVRYIYVQAAYANGTNCTRQLDGELNFLLMNARTRQSVPAKTDMVNRHDGTYIARFRLFKSLESEGLLLIFTFNGRGISVANADPSATTLQPPIYAEECHCPVRSFETYSTLAQCGIHLGRLRAQIEHDLLRLETAVNASEIHKTVSWKEVMDEAMRRYDQPRAVAVVRYVIRDGKLYRKTLGEYVGFTMFTDPMLLSLLRKIALPDTEFIFNLGDYPLSLVKRGQAAFQQSNSPFILPVVSWCGSYDSLDLVVPTYDVTQAVLESMQKVSLDLHTVQQYDAPRFTERKPRAFFRGRDSQPERMRAAELSVSNPELLDVRLTNLFFFRDRYSETRHGRLESPVSFGQFFDYRYQLNLDGTVAAYRFPFLLFGGSLILKQASNYYEHFYSTLANGSHFLALRRDLEDLVETVDSLRSGRISVDEQTRIANAAQQFARTYLTPLGIFCYYAAFFDEYTRFIKRVYRFDAALLDVTDMQLIEQPTATQYGHSASCTCTRKPKPSATHKSDEL